MGCDENFIKVTRDSRYEKLKEKKRMKQKDALDLAKYILSLMIVAIHTGIYPQVLYPWLRLAIPLFFIISSYLLFSKINASDEQQKVVCVKRFIVRNLQYYLFWFVALLPYTALARKDWVDKGIAESIRIIVSHTLFGYTFSASWYITGSIWAVLILYATRKISAKYMTIILIPVYLFCCLCSAYHFTLDGENMMQVFIVFYEKWFTNPANSFPIATVWMFIGKVFADFNQKKSKRIWIGVLLSSVCLWCEWRVLYFLGGNIAVNNDCLLFLVPLSICIFAIIKDLDIQIKRAKVLRNISIVMYPLHASLTGAFRILLSRFGNGRNELLLFILVVVMCHIVTLVILRLEKKKCFSFLRFSH